MKYINKPYNWLKSHPTAVINLLFLLTAASVFLYLSVKPIDVLKDWTLSTSKTAPAGQLPVYYPGSTLEFKSKATKLVSAEGTSSRLFDCDATANAPAREIQLDILSATRAPGTIAEKENSIVVPAVADFKGLPRTCRLVINVCYQNVVLWRDWCETQKTNDFSVQEAVVDAQTIQAQIQALRDQIKVLEDKALNAIGNSTSVTTSSPNSQTTTTTTTENKTINQPSSPSTTSNPQPNSNSTPKEVCGVSALGIKLFCN